MHNGRKSTTTVNFIYRNIQIRFLSVTFDMLLPPFLSNFTLYEQSGMIFDEATVEDISLYISRSEIEGGKIGLAE